MTPRLSDLPLVAPASRAEWRAWLRENHDSSAGIWLAIGKKNGTATSLTYDEAVEEALCFGWIDSTVHAMDAHRFKQLFTPRRPGSHWSPSNKRRVESMLAEGLMTEAGLAVIEAAKADGSWEFLDDIEALIVPDDLQAALDADLAAADYFAELPDSRRKAVLYWVASAKRSTTRSRRIAESIAAFGEGRMPIG